MIQIIGSALFTVKPRAHADVDNLAEKQSTAKDTNFHEGRFLRSPLRHFVSFVIDRFVILERRRHREAECLARLS